ncbi:NAD(P)-binding domain-containing protein [Micromonospora sp. NPDC092111]|uniref:NAD(P)-binding domain-containing protein n=1 Tax=Micromonospora sp. NPDC092111 TaxID=3364289 RepID=UPI00382A0387
MGFIGSGAIGSTIARLAVEAGHQVVHSNARGPETLADTGRGTGAAGVCGDQRGSLGSR